MHIHFKWCYIPSIRIRVDCLLSVKWFVVCLLNSQHQSEKKIYGEKREKSFKQIRIIVAQKLALMILFGQLGNFKSVDYSLQKWHLQAFVDNSINKL